MNPSASDSPSPVGRRSRLWLLRPIAGTGLIVALGLSAWPWIVKQSKAADRTTAISSLKGLGLCLQEFQSEYGRYPDESTAPLVKAASGTILDLSGISSNRLFRQFLVTGLKSEQPFYAPQPGYRRGDNRFDDDAHALAPGEVGFAYLTGETDTASWDPPAILAVAPLIHGTLRVNPEPYGDRAVILRKDNSASALKIEADGLITNSPDPGNLFDAAAPYWRGHPPVVHWAEEPAPSR